MEDVAVSNPVPAVEEPEITSAATMGHKLAEPTTSDSSGGGDGSAASCPWSLMHDQQVQNLKENWKKVLTYSKTKLGDNFEIDPWFANVVAKLRVDPCLDSCKLEVDGWGLELSPLELAVLMGDLKMVEKILEKSSDLGEVLCGSLENSGSKIGDFICILFTSASILFSPLHLAIMGGDSNIVEVLLERGADVNVQNSFNHTPLDFACIMGNVPMLEQLLKNDERGLFHIAVRHGDVDFMKKLPEPEKNVNPRDHKRRTPLHYLAIRRFSNSQVMSDVVQYLAQNKALDVIALDKENLSAFYVAVLDCNVQFVTAFLHSLQNQIRVNEACDEDLGPPIQIAFEGGDKFREIERILMQCNGIKDYVETLYRDRQVYVDAANAILVGAALIAGVTFASWLQPPLNYTSYFGEGSSSSLPAPTPSDLNYVDVENNIALRAFWVFNALSFYFAIGTVVCGARSVLPRSHLFIKKIVLKLRTNLLVTSILLACSVLFVVIAFAIAGTIVLTPLLKYQWCMIVPTLVGGMLCIFSLALWIKNIIELTSIQIKIDNEGSDQKVRNYLKDKGYTLEK